MRELSRLKQQKIIERLLCWVTAGGRCLNTTDLEERFFGFVTLCRGIPKCLRSTVSCAHLWPYRVVPLCAVISLLCFAV